MQCIENVAEAFRITAKYTVFTSKEPFRLSQVSVDRNSVERVSIVFVKMLIDVKVYRDLNVLMCRESWFSIFRNWFIIIILSLQTSIQSSKKNNVSVQDVNPRFRKIQRRCSSNVSYKITSSFVIYSSIPYNITSGYTTKQAYFLQYKDIDTFDTKKKEETCGVKIFVLPALRRSSSGVAASPWVRRFLRSPCITPRVRKFKELGHRNTRDIFVLKIFEYSQVV